MSLGSDPPPEEAEQESEEESEVEEKAEDTTERIPDDSKNPAQGTHALTMCGWVYVRAWVGMRVYMCVRACF